VLRCQFKRYFGDAEIYQEIEKNVPRHGLPKDLSAPRGNMAVAVGKHLQESYS
jgi:hypothetical protein